MKSGLFRGCSILDTGIDIGVEVGATTMMTPSAWFEDMLTDAGDLLLESRLICVDVSL